jgi:kynureninase
LVGHRVSNLMTRNDFILLDERDTLAPLRDQFDLPEGIIYLDGNSLGVLPKATAARVHQVVNQEWGHDLVRSWNTAEWITLPQRVGDKIAQLVGAGAGELVVADSTSVNLFKVLSAALTIAHTDAPARKTILSERFNFPSDIYIAEGLARERDCELVLREPEELVVNLNSEVAVLMLTHVNFRTGRMHDMARLTRKAHDAGALAVWDLAHSAGAVPVELKSANADFAVGCGYKYLNGGPGAPAFVWAHPRHADRFWQPLSGWIGHAAPFEFAPHYRPAAGITRYLCGTPPVISLAALECGVDTVLAARAYGGMGALREKSLSLTQHFIHLVEVRCAGYGLSFVTPREPSIRGSQVCLARKEGAYAIVQALSARGVIGDFRSPDIMRFGFAPLYTRYVDVWDAVEHLSEVLASSDWRQKQFNQQKEVT